MLHNETRKLLIEALNKTHNAKEVANAFLLILAQCIVWLNK